MGWGISFTPEVFISKESYNSIIEIEDTIREIEEQQVQISAILKMWAAACPSDIINCDDDDCGHIMTTLHGIIDEELTSYKENFYKLFTLRLLLEYLQEHPEVDINTLKE